MCVPPSAQYQALRQREGGTFTEPFEQIEKTPFKCTENTWNRRDALPSLERRGTTEPLSLAGATACLDRQLDVTCGSQRMGNFPAEKRSAMRGRAERTKWRENNSNGEVEAAAARRPGGGKSVCHENRS